MKSTNSDNHEEETPIVPHAVTEFFGEVIHSYTRSQAIEDGVLILASEQLAREAGFVIPVAYTSSVYTDCIEWTAEDDDRTGCIQDQKGREWDVLNMAYFVARCAHPGVSAASFILLCVPRFNQSSTTTQPIKLLSEVGPDDHGSPCLTIMYPHEC
jgi:hypothetical protein